MILSLCQWVQNTAFFTAVRESWNIYPAIMATHLLGIAFFGGMILITDMRLLRLAMRDRSISDVVDQLRVAKRVGLLIVVTCGILMLGSKAEEYYYNIYFRIKLLLLLCVFLHGMIFRSSVYANTAALDRAAEIPGGAKLAALLSLLLWAGIVCAGRAIGYVEPPLERIHAGLLMVQCGGRPPVLVLAPPTLARARAAKLQAVENSVRGSETFLRFQDAGARTAGIENALQMPLSQRDEEIN